MTLRQAIEHLRDLNEPVPKPLRLPTTAQVDAVEKELDVKFHPDYRQFLLQASDVVYGALEPATVATLPEVCQGAWDDYEMPRDLLPICEDNGDFYCMNDAGEVVFWSSDGETDESWPNLATWIEQVWIGEAE